jgi:DDE superfamily endonuclease
MQLPLVAPAPLVTTHVAAFRDLFEHRRQFAHFEHYLTGLLVLEHKSRANIARGVLDRADTTNVSRFFSAADWDPAAVNDRRSGYLLGQTRGQRQRKALSALVLDDPLCAQVGSLFAQVDRHYHHGDGT